MARAVFKLSTGGRYKITKFNEGHTHSMVPVDTRNLMHSNRNVDEFQQRLIISGIKANIGPMRTFRLAKEILGSYDDVGCTGNDFKNFARDLKVHSKGSDAHMLLESFSNKQELGNGFKFFHHVDEDNKLCRLIWVDEMSVKNYKFFGDAVSFDATYCTNRYKMIFTPFTGRDNHGKCISFGAGLISHENMESYAWVLDRFVDIMGHAPRLFITDQDPGLKKAVASSWKETRHRFCMWHINTKVAEKLPQKLREDADFRGMYDGLVWNENIDPTVFEENWNNMIEEYDLASSRWFSDMYEDRAKWIPAFFRDVPMSGFFRTTSMSESENSYFKRFIQKNSDLVVLYTNFCSGLDSQRYNYKQATHADETRSPMMKTNLPIECNAAAVYTNAMFKEVQEQIDCSSRACAMRKMFSDGDDIIYEIEDKLDGLFTVCRLHPHDDVVCSCKLFTRKGIPCMHMFLVFRNMNLDTIPHKYVAARWCKYSILCPNDSTDQVQNYDKHSKSNLELRIFKIASESIGYVRGNEELCNQLYENLIEVRDKFAKLGTPENSSLSKNRIFDEFYGSSPTETPSVLPPDVAKTKGSGAGGRRKSKKEKAMLLAQKPKRLCRKCKTRGHHDSRNCPTKDDADLSS
ncbi:protein FAR1-RELATED SEQUENCE 5-like [Salvia miltiorrhiza]|uniref:protein FAR1-RELATED SEQUENCE 5-like n=1 Tax=Salvia miltiorrhiza TaxID=226208 RepID=UPI0025AD5891|nr:protein FAR1-RELATED SEQUENCE 5-like [Salvia miltiorrhiza]